MWWYGFIITIILALTARFVPGIFVPWHETSLGQRVTTPSSAMTPDMRAQKILLIEQAEATTAWKIRADDAELYDTKHVAFVKNVQGQLLRRVTDPLHVTAARGRVDSKTGDMMVEGQVQLDYIAGYTIETDLLYWHAASQVLSTDAAVNIHDTSVYIVGTGLYSNIDDASFVLQSDVRASFQLP
jgi:LPS export ABC transporter protein LptC